MIISDIDWADDFNSPPTQNSLPTSTEYAVNNSDIRNQKLINETERIAHWCNILDLGCTNGKNLVNFYLEVIKDPKGRLNRNWQDIFNKIKRRDRSFFGTFTKQTSIKPLHQKQYDGYIDEFCKNYREAFNVQYINRATIRKIKTLSNKGILITFLRHSTAALKFHEISTLLDYGFNYFMDPNRPKILYEEIYEASKALIFDKLPPIPNNPSDILSKIKIKLPASLPVKHPRDVGCTAGALRTYYKFD